MSADQHLLCRPTGRAGQGSACVVELTRAIQVFSCVMHDRTMQAQFLGQNCFAYSAAEGPWALTNRQMVSATDRGSSKAPRCSEAQIRHVVAPYSGEQHRSTPILCYGFFFAMVWLLKQDPALAGRVCPGQIWNRSCCCALIRSNCSLTAELRRHRAEDVSHSIKAVVRSSKLNRS